MVVSLVAAALAAASPLGAPAGPPADQPAMFVVRDADTTIYIFGTFHALDGRSQWFGPQVRDAFEQSDELVLETLVPEKPVAQLAPPLRAPSVIPSASFLATTRLAINAGRTQGMQVGNGADMVLRRVAEAEGKPVEGLETLQLQIDMFSHAGDARATCRATGRNRLDGQPFQDDGRDAGRLEARGPECFRAHARPVAAGVAGHLPDDVHRAE